MDCLWSPPEQAGWLLKQSHSKRLNDKWMDRFFVLKGSFLFYFKDRKNVSKIAGVIPLENAKVETEPPQKLLQSKRLPEGQHYITITLHATHTYTCKHAYYILQAQTPEVQSAWVNALWQASIPRSELVGELSKASLLPNLVASYSAQLQQCFPCLDASVLSTSGRARLSGTIVNIGGLAGVLRRARATNRRSQDVNHLPTLASATPPTVLARTASGSIIPTAPASLNGPNCQSSDKRRLSDCTAAVVVESAEGNVGAAVTTTAVTTAVSATRKSQKKSLGPEGGLREQFAAIASAANAANAETTD